MQKLVKLKPSVIVNSNSTQELVNVSCVIGSNCFIIITSNRQAKQNSMSATKKYCIFLVPGKQH